MKDHPDWWKGEKAQALLASDARKSIMLDMLEDIFDGKTDFSSMDMEYWSQIHDKASKFIRKNGS